MDDWGVDRRRGGTGEEEGAARKETTTSILLTLPSLSETTPSSEPQWSSTGHRAGMATGGGWVGTVVRPLWWVGLPQSQRCRE